jgi:hypothetical protein
MALDCYFQELRGLPNESRVFHFLTGEDWRDLRERGAMFYHMHLVPCVRPEESGQGYDRNGICVSIRGDDSLNLPG